MLNQIKSRLSRLPLGFSTGKIKIIVNSICISAMLFLFTSDTFSIIRLVSVEDFIFTPANLNITVGDTVRWFWINGDHTTTSMTVPTGALPWNAVIDNSSQTFNYPVTVAGAYTYKCTPHFPSMIGTITVNPFGIIKISNEVPESFTLGQNYPNPFNPGTHFGLRIANFGMVTVKVFDMLGREVKTLVNEQLQPGTYEVDFDGSNLASGTYIYQLTAVPFDKTQGVFTDTKKMILVK